MTKFYRIYEDGTKIMAHEKTLQAAIGAAYSLNKRLETLGHAKIQKIVDSKNVAIAEIELFPQRFMTKVMCYSCGKVDFPYREDDNWFRCPKCGHGWRFEL